MISPPNMSLLLIMVCFWIVFFLVWGLLVKPLGKVLDERDRSTREARDTLSAVEASTSEALARCDRELAAAAAEAQKERTALRAAGEGVRRSRLEAARAQAQEKLAELKRDLDKASGEARAELRRRAEGLAVRLAERLLGRRLAQ